MKKRTAGRRCIGLLMVCVLCLNLPPMKARSADKDVHLADAKGSVSLENAGGRALKHFSNMKLPNGSRVKTGQDGSAQFGFGENGELILENCGALELRVSKSIPEVLLDRGAVFFDLTGSSIALNVRTSIAAVTIEDARGRVWVRDGQHTLICLEEGELRCSVADPVSGQVKTARLSGGKTAECVVYPMGEKGKYCDILLREMTAEDKDGNAVCDGEEGSRLFALRDPVWETDLTLADAPKTEETVPEEDDSNIQDSSEDQTTKYYPGIYLPPTMPLPHVPLGWDNALAEKPESSDSGHIPGSGSASSSTSDSGSASAQPGTEAPTPSEPETTSPALTEDRGLVLNIAKNGSTGRIEVINSGKVFVQNQELLNEGNIVLGDRGVIEGEIINDSPDAYFTIIGDSGLGENSGKVTRVSNTSNGGNIILDGGTIEEGVSIAGGDFHMRNGMVKAPNNGSAIYASGGTVEIDKTVIVKASEPLKTLEVDATSGTPPTIIYHRENGDSGTWTNGEGLLYITQKSLGGSVELCGLRDEFSGAVEDINDKVRPGDTITLSGDVTDSKATETNLATGGTENAPILLDLHENMLVMQRLKPGNYTDGTICFDDKAVWRIENGTLLINGIGRSLHIKDSGKLTLAGITLSGSLYNYDGSKLMITNTEIKRGDIYNCYNSDCFISGTEAYALGSYICNDKGSRLTISDGSQIMTSINNGEGAFTPAVVTDRMKLYEEKPGQMTISESRVGNIWNNGAISNAGITEDKADNYANNTIIKVKAAQTGDIENDGGRIEVFENSQTGDISNSDGAVAVSGSIVKNLKNLKQGNKRGTLTISDSSTVVLDEYAGSVSRSIGMKGIENRNGVCTISDSVIQLKDGSSRLYNSGDDSSFSLSNSRIAGEISIENVGGKVDISEPKAAIKGMIDTSRGGACTLTQCDLTVIDKGIAVSGSKLYIDGGTYLRENTNGGTAIISINAYDSGEDTSTIRIGGGAELLNVAGVTPIHLTTHGSSLGAFDITIDRATIRGGDSSVLRSEFNRNYTIVDGAERKLTINEGAVLSSGSTRGTIDFDGLEQRSSRESSAWNLQLKLNGGSIINENETENTGFALSFGKVNDEDELLKNVSFGEIGTELRAMKADPIVWFNSSMVSIPYYPNGYTFSYSEPQMLSPENLTNNKNADPISPSNASSSSTDTKKEEDALPVDEVGNGIKEEVKIEEDEDLKGGDNLK